MTAKEGDHTGHIMKVLDETFMHLYHQVNKKAINASLELLMDFS